MTSGPTGMDFFDDIYYYDYKDVNYTSIESIPKVNSFLSGNTLIRTNAGEHTLLSTIVGDLAPGKEAPCEISVIGTGLTPTKTRKMFAGGEQLVTIIKTSNGRSLTATDSHRILYAHKNGDDGFDFSWRRLSELSIGDIIVTNPQKSSVDGALSFELAPVVSISPAGIELVYSLIVDAPDEAFIANDFINNIPYSR